MRLREIARTLQCRAGRLERSTLGGAQAHRSTQAVGSGVAKYPARCRSVDPQEETTAIRVVSIARDLHFAWAQ